MRLMSVKFVAGKLATLVGLSRVYKQTRSHIHIHHIRNFCKFQFFLLKFWNFLPFFFVLWLICFVRWRKHGRRTVVRDRMHEQEISLRWKSFHSNILSNFESMWEEEGLVDVTLASDGKCLKAHKIMLSASSPFFKKIFQMNPCQHPVVVLQDVHYSELESILKFVYKGEVCIRQENLPLLLRAAETLQIRGLCRHLGSEPNSEEAVNSRFVTTKKNSNDNSIVSKTPPTSPKCAKKLKTNHNCRTGEVQQPTSPTASPRDDLTIPVFPVMVDNIKCEPGGDSPDDCDTHYDSEIAHAIPLMTASQNLHSDEDEPDISVNTNESAFDLDPSSSNFPFPPFPCPFCDRTYTRWGFRRRHIKACHTMSQSLPCKWCLEVLPTHADWASHVCLKHNLSRNDAKNGLLILEEAEVVLQIPQPSRLDALVTMIKEQGNAKQTGDISKIVRDGEDEAGEDGGGGGGGGADDNDDEAGGEEKKRKSSWSPKR